MCLISVLLRVWDKNKIKAVHVQHGIRGESSLADAAFVENFCRENGIELFRFDADIPSMAQKSGSSLESEARLYRKKVFADILSEKKADFLLLAHHRLDCAESVLMHVFRGSGINGLRGMSECDGKIVRPLASIDKSEISSYVKEHGISFCVDENQFGHGLQPQFYTEKSHSARKRTLRRRSRSRKTFFSGACRRRLYLLAYPGRRLHGRKRPLFV